MASHPSKSEITKERTMDSFCQNDSHPLPKSSGKEQSSGKLKFIKTSKFHPDIIANYSTKYEEEKKKGKWIANLRKKNGETWELNGHEEVENEEQLEYYAILNILEFLKDKNDYKNIVLYTNSIYVKVCLTEWIPRWVKHNFEIVDTFLTDTIKMRPNYKLLQRIHELSKTKKLRIKECISQV